MSKHLTVGSLFAGIGGFDLAAERAGMEVKWQSQWEPPRWGWNAIAKKIKNRKVKAGLRENPKFGRWIDDPQKASLVLDHHFPDIPNYGDIHEIRNPPAVDILCGGFPCQDYSVAGARHGLAGDRGALWWEFHRLIDEVRPTWVVAENVPGLLSSRGGRDFETIIGSLTQLGYGVAWAVLDAQYFGVAQRRRRVFIVGHSGGIPRPEVLALGEGVFGHPEPRREARPRASTGTPLGIGGGDLSPAVTSSTGGLSAKQNQHALVYSEGSAENYRQVEATDAITEGAGSRRIEQIVAYALQPDDQNLGRGGLRAQELDDRSPTLGAYNPNHSDRGALIVGAFAQNQRDEVRDLGDVAGALNAEPGMKQQTYVLQDTTRSEKDQNGAGWSDGDVSYTLDGQSRPGVVATGFKDSRRDGIRIFQEDVSPTLEAQMGTGGNNTPMVDTPTVRRLTPLECERLQGFPDGWTDIPGNSDTQRYKQLGNAVAVPVAEWIFRRIVAAESGRIL